MYRFHVDDIEGEEGIGHGMIIGQDLIVKLVLKIYFKKKVLSWDDNIVPTKDQGKFLDQTDLTKCEIQKVIMQTVEGTSTK